MMLKSERIILIVLLVFSLNCYSQNFWQQTNGPYGGGIISFAGKNSGELFCGTSYAGGIFRSTDSGNTWVKVHTAYAFSEAVHCIAADNNGDIYTGRNGVLRSTDNGNTWNQISSFLTPHAIAINSTGHIFAGGLDGKLYRTTNSGVNWDIVLNTFSEIKRILIKNNGYIYAASQSLRLSTDNGLTWSIISLPGMNPANDLAIDSTGSILLSNYVGLHKSSNNGVNWSQIYSASASTAISVSQSNIYYAGVSGGKIIKSTDNGASWIDIFVNNSGGTLSITTLYCKQLNYIIAGTSLGVMRTSNSGASWERINDGITQTHISDLCFDGNSKIFAGLSGGGIFMTSNNGLSWNQSGFLNKYVTAIGNNGLNIFAGVNDTSNSTYVSTNGGLNWNYANNGLTNTGFIHKYLSVNGVVFLASESGVFRTTNNGMLWTPSLINGNPIKYIDHNSSNEVFAVSESIVYKSTNYGINWTNLTTAGMSVNGFVVLQLNGYMYYLRNGTLFRSTNIGLNWSQISNENALGRIMTGPGNNLFGYGRDSLFRSTDFGISWQQFQAGILITDGIVLAFDNQGYAYAGTWGASVYKSINSVIAIHSLSENIPQTFSLSQNYPNPFNPVTNIKFDLPKPGFVNMTIYDLLGREITTLVNQQMHAGSYSADWDASAYPSGVYFYKIEAGDFVETRKMILVK